ncbi:unnamed protein product [Amoebophrya sp. A25]|nr:unnamed protein product [Amoebophrya sp. A25]|eukprot:GSA25T00026451001.1
MCIHRRERKAIPFQTVRDYIFTGSSPSTYLTTCAETSMGFFCVFLKIFLYTERKCCYYSFVTTRTSPIQLTDHATFQRMS